MAGQPYVWQVSTPNIGTGKGVISSAYEVDGKSPLTTITSTNPDGFVRVNSLSNDPIVSKTEYKIDEKGTITYRYTNQKARRYQAPTDHRSIHPWYRLSGYSRASIHSACSSIRSPGWGNGLLM